MAIFGSLYAESTGHVGEYSLAGINNGSGHGVYGQSTFGAGIRGRGQNTGAVGVTAEGFWGAYGLNIIGNAKFQNEHSSFEYETTLSKRRFITSWEDLSIQYYTGWVWVEKEVFSAK